MSDGTTLDAAYLIGLRPLSLRAPDRSDPAAGLPGGYVTRRHGHGQELADLRAYVAGDDTRHLDPSATARTGELHVRTYRDERDRTTLLVADMRPSMIWGLKRAFLSVAAAEALTTIGWHAVENGGRVGLAALVGDAPELVRPRARTRGMLDVISGMVRSHTRALDDAARAADDAPLDRLLGAVERIAPTGATVVIASSFDTPGPRFASRLGELARRATLRLITVGDGAHRNLPAGLYPIASAEGRFVTEVAGEIPEDGAASIGWPALPIAADMPPAQTAAHLWSGHERQR